VVELELVDATVPALDAADAVIQPVVTLRGDFKQLSLDAWRYHHLMENGLRLLHGTKHGPRGDLLARFAFLAGDEMPSLLPIQGGDAQAKGDTVASLAKDRL
jgi:hypothetical protein